jgi:hypothetical protein
MTMRWLLLLAITLPISKQEIKIDKPIPIIDISGTCTFSGIPLTITDDYLIIGKDDKTYRVPISNKTFIVSWGEIRIEHTIPSAKEWLKNNPNSFVKIGVYKSKCSDVILVNNTRFGP